MKRLLQMLVRNSLKSVKRLRMGRVMNKWDWNHLQLFERRRVKLLNLFPSFLCKRSHFNLGFYLKCRFWDSVPDWDSVRLKTTTRTSLEIFLFLIDNFYFICFFKWVYAYPFYSLKCNRFFTHLKKIGPTCFALST